MERAGMGDEMNDGRILGVLGGMGPLAGAVFMDRLTRLTPAAREQDHVPAILWSDPRVPPRTVGRGVTGPADPLPWLLRGVRGLRAAGCGAIAIACNTAHLWADEIAADIAPAPLLHIVDATIAALATAGVPRGATLGLMGTAATLEADLYQSRLATRGHKCLVPDASEMELLVKPGIRLVKENRVAEAAPPLIEATQALVRRGAAAIVLGCTEIPIALRDVPGADLGAPAIDTMDALALVAIRWARGAD